MARKPPFFITGANAKIKLNGRTVAFATDVSYSVEVMHAEPQLLGMYEAANIEPLAYRVAGNLTIIRYAKNMKDFLEHKEYSTPDNVSNQGNSIGSYKDASIIDYAISGGKADRSLDPATLDQAVKFDIEIYQKSNDPNDIQGIARLRACRLIRSDFSMSKKQPAIQRFAFKAIYLDEDGFYARPSGVGQQFL